MVFAKYREYASSIEDENYQFELLRKQGMLHANDILCVI